jgi:hypothetical protein
MTPQVVTPMSDLQEPVRWLDDTEADDDLRADLGLARAACPSGIDFAMLSAALHAAIADQDAPLPAASGSGFWQRASS